MLAPALRTLNGDDGTMTTDDFVADDGVVDVAAGVDAVVGVAVVDVVDVVPIGV